VFDSFIPVPSAGWTLRQRGDGTAGVCDPSLGASVEIAADETELAKAIDGHRTLTEIAEHHASEHGFIPFTAFRDLLRTLSAAGLLTNSRELLTEHGLTGPDRRTGRWLWGRFFSRRTPLAGRFSFAESAVVLLFAGILSALVPQDWGGTSVLLTYLGASLALAARASFRGAALAASGRPPMALELSHALGVVYAGPEGTSAVLLDRLPRLGCHLAALGGPLLVFLCCSRSPFLQAGAAAVLLGDLCPFLPTSMGHLLSAGSGHIDMAEHARAYLSHRIVSRAMSSFFEGEAFLVLNLLLSLAWFAAIIQLLWTRGVLAVLLLLRAAMDETLPLSALSYLGALLLTLSMPAAVGCLLWGLFKALRSAFPSRAGAAGASTGNLIDAAELSTIPLFSTLDATHQGALARATTELKYGPGDLIVRQGDPGDAFFAIRTGHVVVEQQANSGLIREVARLGPGDCFGEIALLESTPRMASVRASEVVVLAQISRKAFEEACTGVDHTQVTSLIRAAAALHKSRFFSRMPPERLGSLAARLRPEEVSAGSTVVQLGDRGTDFYLIGSGQFEVLDAQGAAVARLGPGDHFGEVSLLRDTARNATVRATETSLVLSLPKSDFLRAMGSDLTLSATLEVVAAERTGRLA
jgi:CRP-like cAMP-binding protein